jgi:nickel superoxide dismutase|tara:strand:- start:287 stop:721 length:435 start_codon:yes stop_codon:yes gene_type:complete
MLNLIGAFSKIGVPISVAHAHCDIPCGIYDPRDAIQAAQTVVRMTELIEEIDFSGGPSKELGNSLMRYVSVKEDHAKKAKEDILIIWTDYFKPEHLEKYPDLHEKVWNACKLGSYVKQNVDLAKAKEFKASLEEIGEIFWETKK